MAVNRTGGPARFEPRDHGFMRAFSSLRVYNYRLYWTGQLISLTGTWMQRLAQAWLVLNLTNSPFALGTVITLQFLPLSILSLFGGVLADRIPKRRLLITTQSVAAVQALIIAVLTSTGLIQLWHVYVLALMLGLTNAFDNPARQSFPVELVGRDEVANAVALNFTLMNASRIAGPSLAGIAIATIGLAGCFWLNAVSFLGTICALIAMKPDLFFSIPARPHGRTLSLLRDGVVYARRTPAVFVLLIQLLFFGTFAYNFNVVLPLLAKFTLHTSSLGYGFLFAALGAGSLVAALTLAYTRMQSQRTVVLGGLALVVALIGLGLSHQYVISLVLLALTGGCSIMYSASTQTRLQVIVPDALRGRTMSLYTQFQAGTTPIGSLFIGAVSQRWDPGVALVTAGGLSAIGLVLAGMYVRGRSPNDMVRGTVLEPGFEAGLPMAVVLPLGGGSVARN